MVKRLFLMSAPLTRLVTDLPNLVQPCFIPGSRNLKSIQIGSASRIQCFSGALGCKGVNFWQVRVVTPPSLGCLCSSPDRNLPRHIAEDLERASQNAQGWLSSFHDLQVFSNGSANQMCIMDE